MLSQRPTAVDVDPSYRPTGQPLPFEMIQGLSPRHPMSSAGKKASSLFQLNWRRGLTPHITSRSGLQGLHNNIACHTGSPELHLYRQRRHHSEVYTKARPGKPADSNKHLDPNRSPGNIEHLTGPEIEHFTELCMHKGALRPLCRLLLRQKPSVLHARHYSTPTCHVSSTAADLKTTNDGDLRRVEFSQVRQCRALPARVQAPQVTEKKLMQRLCQAIVNLLVQSQVINLEDG